MEPVYDQIKQRLSIGQVLNHYGYRIGKGNFIVCPFHQEKTPSLKIYPNNNSYYCFGCGAGGDVISFVRNYFKIPYLDAIKKIDADFALGLFEKPTLTQYRHMKQQEKERAAQRETLQQAQEYNKYAWKSLNNYDWWLKSQPDSVAKQHDMAYMERLLNQFRNPNVEVKLCVDALILALKTKFESET